MSAAQVLEGPVTVGGSRLQELDDDGGDSAASRGHYSWKESAAGLTGREGPGVPWSQVLRAE